jgi:hypothetical protein
MLIEHRAVPEEYINKMFKILIAKRKKKYNTNSKQDYSLLEK